MPDERDRVMIFRTGRRVICPGRHDCDCDATKRCKGCDHSKVTCDAVDGCCTYCNH